MKHRVIGLLLAYAVFVTHTQHAGAVSQDAFPMKPEYQTAADCSPGRHWELVNGHARCVCNGDNTHSVTGNNQTCPFCAGPNLVQNTYPIQSDGSFSATSTQAVLQSNSSQCKVATATSCIGTSLEQNWSDGSQTLLSANSSACKVAISTTCSGTTLMQNWSDGSQSVLGANSSKCTNGTTCSGSNLMQVWGDGSQTLLQANTSQCKIATTTTCPNTDLMQNWSDGTQTLFQANASVCGGIPKPKYTATIDLPPDGLPAWNSYIGGTAQFNINGATPNGYFYLNTPTTTCIYIASDTAWYNSGDHIPLDKYGNFSGILIDTTILSTQGTFYIIFDASVNKIYNTISRLIYPGNTWTIPYFDNDLGGSSPNGYCW